MKICFRCKEEKPVEQFFRDKHTPSGYSSSCKACLKTGVAICKKCGKEFKYSLKDSVGKYCSRKCSNSRFTGRIHLRAGYPIKYIRKENGKSVHKVFHTIAAEKALGRPLKSDERVHHIDMNRANYQNKNLLICSMSYHYFLHHRYQQKFAELMFGGNNGNNAFPKTRSSEA